jgi:predicted GH43/DUF377 family glycosyl hydrolase
MQKNLTSHDSINQLCMKFEEYISEKDFDSASSIMNTTKLSYPKNIDIHQQQMMVYQYYTNHSKSILLFDQYSLYRGFNSVPLNGFYYSKQIEYSSKKEINIDLEYPYKCMNPSIIKLENEYLMNLRVVNYTHSKGIYSSPDGIIRTRNFLLKLDDDLNIKESNEIIPPTFPRKCNIVGLEDCRIFKYNNLIYFTCSTFENHYLNSAQVSLGIIDNDKIVKLNHLKTNFTKTCEKNWLPFVRNDKIEIIYSSEPFTILNYDLSIKSSKNSLIKTPFRGSATPIEFDNGYLYITHDVYNNVDSERAYVHRLVWFVDDEIKKISHQFYFEKYQIEYCSGLCHGFSNDVLMTIGVNDERAYVYEVDINEMRKMLLPLSMFIA